MYNNLNKKYLILIIIFLISHNFSYGVKQRMINSFSSSITVTIRGTGMLNVFYGGSCSAGNFNRPNKIYINKVKQNQIKEKYQFNESPNFVKLEWDNTNNNCNCLFRDCINIVDIDFSQFDFSSGLYANQMFYNCKSLTSIDLHSYGTIKFYNVAEMFSYCESLYYLDLSQFEISSLDDTH